MTQTTDGLHDEISNPSPSAKPGICPFRAGELTILFSLVTFSCSSKTSQTPSTLASEPIAPAETVHAARSDDSDSQNLSNSDLDVRVRNFLIERKGSWRDANVPYKDGNVLFDLVVKGNYTSILEIGTSTGHSTIWLAWAASKTGGRVTTIEIDSRRHQTAVSNLKAAGVLDYVDARRADAHQLVKELPGPFDFVFSDADKDWYIQYFEDIDPKLSVGGCIAAHNALNGFKGVDAYIDHVRKRSDYETRIDRTSRSGFAISCKRAQTESKR